MKTKSFLSLTCAIGLLALAVQANAALVLTNGNFSDTTGMTDLTGGWYSGVPYGWTGLANSTYAVLIVGSVGYANLQALSHTTAPWTALDQNIGTTSGVGDVTLTFELAPTVFGSLSVSAGIYNATTVVNLAASTYNGEGTWTLTAPNVAADTSIMISFWGDGWNPTPALTNVSVVPEPATWTLLAFSLTAVVVLLRRRQPRNS